MHDITRAVEVAQAKNPDLHASCLSLPKNTFGIADDKDPARRLAWKERGYLFLTTNSFPERMAHTLCFNRKPVVLIDVSVTRHASSHTPRELREYKQSNTFIRAVELLVSLRRQKSMRASRIPLHPLKVNELPYRDQIPISANALWIDVHSLQSW